MGISGNILILGAIGIGIYLLKKNDNSVGYSGGLFQATTSTPPSGDTITAPSESLQEIIEITRYTDLPSGDSVSGRGSSRRVVTPGRAETPTQTSSRIQSQALIARKLDLPRNLYSIALPAQAAFGRSLTRPRTVREALPGLYRR